MHITQQQAFDFVLDTPSKGMYDPARSAALCAVGFPSDPPGFMTLDPEKNPTGNPECIAELGIGIEACLDPSLQRQRAAGLVALESAIAFGDLDIGTTNLNRTAFSPMGITLPIIERTDLCRGATATATAAAGGARRRRRSLVSNFNVLNKLPCDDTSEQCFSTGIHFFVCPPKALASAIGMLSMFDVRINVQIDVTYRDLASGSTITSPLRLVLFGRLDEYMKSGDCVASGGEAAALAFDEAAGGESFYL